MKLLPSLLPLVVGSALWFAGCNKSEAPATRATTAPADGAVSVEITANDTMKFSVTEIRAAAGQKVRVAFTNLGHTPKQAMGHNWVLFTIMPDADLTGLVQGAASRAPDYLPADASKILAHTKLLGPGESDAIEFVSPTQPGDYPFVCTFPGHAALMRGKLIVTAAKP